MEEKEEEEEEKIEEEFFQDKYFSGNLMACFMNPSVLFISPC